MIFISLSAFGNTKAGLPNLGDLASSPLDIPEIKEALLEEGGIVISFNILNMDSTNIESSYEAIKIGYNTSDGKYCLVIGGGYLLTAGFFPAIDKNIRAFKHYFPKGKVIAWGVELHKEEMTALLLDSIDLIGCRNSPNLSLTNKKIYYVPCASCMLPIFSSAFSPPKQNYVVYDHYKFPIQGLKYNNYNTRNNIGGDRKAIDTAIKFLADSNTIITNSYHGAYWSYLLNKNVMIIENMHNKAKMRGIKEIKAKSQGTALGFCRMLNKLFLNRVKELLYVPREW